MRKKARISIEGLCASCRHRRLVRAERSSFVRCALGVAGGDWPRYPRLPVMECEKFEEEAAE